ncbi:Rieske 2Fe-2S domain-containing protein [Streptomyces sp. ISL-98]|uniref:Rieske 2Fe-2S domain-containing protein n=1 Tax=Streptomyces sp. ISL-98 TaxID=2819192 RepID=UPI001BE7CB39|nr:Rieske 2Fe-2S domain-containing protein [Streptomyces sp. ISL-98]MBT2511736.1 Rieske 2Fe-2S domain-containing protein [Streptomyces sp. ISL-98]
MTRRPRPQSYDLELHHHLPPGADRGPVTAPTGWYFARFSKHLRCGQVVPVTYLSREYALFRTDSGQIGMVESQCCHMGAHLARGGYVRNESLTCGFHAWEFDVTGRCVKIPGGCRIPSRARQRSLTVAEHSGCIWFWHGPGPAQPFTDLDHAQDRRHYLHVAGEVHVCHSDLLTVSEHVTDVAHWPCAHGAPGPMTYVPLRDEGPHFSFMIQPVDADITRVQRFRPYARVTMASPTLALVTAQSQPQQDTRPPLLTVIAAVSPVGPELTIAMWAVVVRKLGPDWLLWPVNRLWAAFLRRLVQRNAASDLDVLRWRRPVAKDLWSAADGPSVRAYRNFYRRNLPPQGTEHTTAQLPQDAS